MATLRPSTPTRARSHARGRVATDTGVLAGTLGGDDEHAALIHATARAAAQHNAFLDLVRAVAIVRVLAWHTYGFAWMSYLVASMPAMFFVAGSLMAHSLERDGALHVLYTRFRRLLVPLWAFGAVAMGIMVSHALLHGASGEHVTWGQAVFWLFPIWDPQGSDWGVTWWAVLWYLRCMTWLILLSPILLPMFHKMGVALLALPLAFIGMFEYLQQSGSPVPWQFEDLALFGFFWLLGFCHNARLFNQLGTRVRALCTALAAVCALLWVTTQDVPGMVVNASYPAHLFVGLAWLFGALTFEKALVSFATTPPVAGAIAWVNDRIFTIYLWHAAGLFAMYQLLYVHDRPDWLRNAVAFPLVVAVTFACMLAFGWIEDFAARRHLHLAPDPGPHHWTRGKWANHWLVPSIATCGVVVMMSATFIDAGQTVLGTSTPSMVPASGVGLAYRTSHAQILEAPPQVSAAPPSAAAVTAGELQALLDRWLADNKLQGATLSIRRPDGEVWNGASGRDAATSAALAPDHVYNIASVTKTFSVALILQLVEQGKISLQDPVSRFVPEFSHAREITVRQLIQHTSGLMATDGVAPAEALTAAAARALDFTPGTGFEYSSPGYYLLGLIVERVHGLSFTSALHAQLLDPLGLVNTHMDEEIAPLSYSTHPLPAPSLRSSSGVLQSSSGLRLATASKFEYRGILWSAAGMVSNVSDLSKWALDLWDGTGVLSASMQTQMTTFLGPEFEYAGLGTYPFCPCWRDNGRLEGERWGHLGRSGALEYDPRDRIAVAMYTSGTDIDERLIAAYDDLSKRVRDLVRGRDIESVDDPATP